MRYDFVSKKVGKGSFFVRFFFFALLPIEANAVSGRVGLEEMKRVEEILFFSKRKRWFLLRGELLLSTELLKGFVRRRGDGAISCKCFCAVEPSTCWRWVGELWCRQIMLFMVVRGLC